MAWVKLGSTEWSSGTTVDSPEFTASKFLQIMTYSDSGSVNRSSLQFGDPTVDTGSNYAYRSSQSGGSDGTSISVASILIHTGDDYQFTVSSMINIATEEKLSINHVVTEGSAGGAGNAPDRVECVGKYAETTNQQTVVRLYDTTTNLTAGNISVIGSDGTESTKLQDGAIFYETDTNKEFLLYNNTWTEL